MPTESETKTPQPPSRTDISEDTTTTVPAPEPDNVPETVVRATLDVPFVCGFNHRDAMNVRQTYPVPPVTTLKGMVHAALEHPSRLQLNLQDDDNYSEVTSRQTQFSEVTQWGIRALGGRNGELIPVTQHLANRMKADKGSGYISQAITEEVLVEPSFIIYIGAPTSVAEEIAAALRRPPYPLSLGKSDHLVDIHEVTVCDPEVVVESAELDCVVPGIHEIETACILPMESEPDPEDRRRNPLPAPAEPVTVSGGHVDGWIEIMSSEAGKERFVFID